MSCAARLLSPSINMLNRIIQRLRPYRKIVLFLISGASAAAIEYMAFLSLEYLTNINTMASQAISFCCGLVVSFVLNKYWVFKDRASVAYKRQAMSFFILGIMNLIVTTVLIGVITIYITPFVAKIILMICVAVWNYLILNAIIFRRR